MSIELRERLQSSLGNTYTVERELGGGGMSRVFVAEETALGRKVVVKVLSPELTHELSAERFAREIRLAASLQHANIVPVHSAGVAGDVPYYTMPLVEGRSLRERLAEAHGQLPLSESVGILRDVARALDYAHTRGVVHRDIKPENVLLSGGAAVVTDFGIAKAVSLSRTAQGATLTHAGTALGTPAYMAPEQALGDEVDARADIYAWGVLAYELLAGVHPFVDRTTAQQLVGAHIGEMPQALEARNADLDPALAALVMRCLAKMPADRPSSARELLETLDVVATPGSGRSVARRASRSARWGTVVIGAALVVAVGFVIRTSSRSREPGALGGMRTLAVLPFESASSDTADNFLAEGVSDELRSGLTGARGLSVKARVSSLRFRSGAADVGEAGRKLETEAVLIGTLTRSRDRVRIVAELLAAANGNALWSATFERPATDLGPLQDSILSGVRRALGVEAPKDLAGTRGGSRARGTTNEAAYQLYMRAEHATDVGDFGRAITLLEDAVSRDPRYARAQAMLAYAYALLPEDGLHSRDSAIAASTRVLATAQLLDPNEPRLTNARAALLFLKFEFVEAERVLARAIVEHPDDAELRLAHGFGLIQLGRLREAAAELRSAAGLDPLNLLTLTNIAAAEYATRDFTASIASSRSALQLDPQNPIVYAGMAMTFIFSGRADSAVGIIERARELDSTTNSARIIQLLALTTAERWTEANRLRPTIEREPPGNSPHFKRGFLLLALRRFDEAAEELATSLDAGEPVAGVSMLACDPAFDPLKARPIFIEALQRRALSPCPPDVPSAAPRRAATAPR